MQRAVQRTDSDRAPARGPVDILAADLLLVPCILRAPARLDFVLPAIRHFRRPDYPNKELIIVDPLGAELLGFVSADLSARSQQILEAKGNGGLMNSSHMRARGRIIEHWDNAGPQAARRYHYPGTRGDITPTSDPLASTLNSLAMNLTTAGTQASAPGLEPDLRP